MDRSAYSRELLRIVRTCNVNRVRALIGLVDVNARDELGRTPLHLAVAFNKNAEVVRALLDQDDIDVNCVDQLGRSPLHLCVFCHKEEFLKPGEAERQLNAGKALVEETIEQWVGMVKPQKRNGASSSGSAEKWIWPVAPLIKSPGDSASPSGQSEGEDDEQGEAGQGGQEEETGGGLSGSSTQGPEIHEEDDDSILDSYSAGHGGEYGDSEYEDYDAYGNDHAGHGGLYAGNGVELARMIMKKGADVNIAAHVTYVTPLHLAARLGHVKMVKQLLTDPKLNLRKTTVDGHTALHLVTEGHRRSHIPNGVRKPTMDDLCEVIHLIREAKRRRNKVGERKSNLVNMVDCMGRTALHYAAQDGCVSLVRELLAFNENNDRFQKIDVNVADIYAYTPLHLAVRGGYTAADVANKPKQLQLGPLLAVTKLLLEIDDIDINLQSHVSRSAWRSPDIQPITEIHTDYFLRPILITWPIFGSWNNSPLHFAARDGHADIVQVLLHRREVALNLVDSDGHTALQLAARNGHLEVLQKLLLHHAAREGFKNLVEILHSHDRHEIVDSILQEKEEAIVNAGNLHGPDTNPMFQLLNNLLGVATEHEQEEMASFLLESLDKSKLVLGQRKGKGGYLLHWAAETGNLRIVQYVVRWASKSAMMNAQDLRFLTPLHYAIQGCHDQDAKGVFFQVLKELLSFKNLDVNIHGGRDEVTPLHIAVAIGNFAVVRLLLTEAGERLRANEEDINKKTALEIAIESLKEFLEDTDARQQAIKGDNTITKEQAEAKVENERKQASAKRHIVMLLQDRPDVKDYLDRLYRDRQTYVDAANSLLVGAALIAGVAFVGWLQPPSGYTDEGVVKLSAASQCFFVFNALAFFGGMAAVIAGADGALLDEETFIRSALKSTRIALMWTITLLMLSVVCVLGAFVSAAVVVYRPTDRKQLIGFGFGLGLGVLMCLTAVARFIAKVLRKKKPRRPYQSLNFAAGEV